MCACPLKSVRSLDAHVGGRKHISRAMEKKRADLGIPAPPIAAPKMREKKKAEPRR